MKENIFTPQYERELRAAFEQNDMSLFFTLLASFNRTSKEIKMLDDFTPEKKRKFLKSRFCAEYLRPLVKKVCYEHYNALSLKCPSKTTWPEIILMFGYNLMSEEALNWFDAEMYHLNPYARLNEPQDVDVTDIDDLINFYSDALSK